jgi:streptogramin lyase
MSSTRTNNSFFLGAVAAVAVVAALLLLAYGSNPAQAAGSCSTTSGTTTCTYVSTGAEDTFVVPEGVSSVDVVATGAPGAVAFNSGDNTPAPPVSVLW